MISEGQNMTKNQLIQEKEKVHEYGQSVFGWNSMLILIFITVNNEMSSLNKSR